MGEPQAAWTMRMPQALLDALDVYAYKRGQGRTACVLELIAAAVEPERKRAHGNVKYATDAERIAAQRESWRQSKRRKREAASA